LEKFCLRQRKLTNVQKSVQYKVDENFWISIFSCQFERNIKSVNIILWDIHLRFRESLSASQSNLDTPQ
jgi:hypothetical protein